MSDYALEEKVILITGAAGGIGAACAREFHRRGARLVITDVAGEPLNALAAELGDKQALALPLDVTDSTACAGVVARTVAHFGRLDIVFANAGIAWRDAPSTMAACDPDEFERIMNVDLFGVWRTIKPALSQVIANNGQVLITASLYAYFNGMVNAPYAASKAAVEMLGRALRAELAGTGASASVVYPGWIATPIADVAFGGNALATQLVEKAFPKPLRKPIPPERVAVAAANGLLTRRPRIFVPWRWAPLSLLRGMVNAATDRMLDRNRDVQQLVREIERESASRTQQAPSTSRRTG